MPTKPDHAVTHVLSIIEGHTGMTFSQLNISSNMDDNGIGTFLWASDVEPITGGIMNIVATSVRVQITVPVKIIDTEPYIDGSVSKNDYAVRVVLVFKTPSGGEFSTTRIMQFRGDFFRRFDQ